MRREVPRPVQEPRLVFDSRLSFHVSGTGARALAPGEVRNAPPVDSSPSQLTQTQCGRALNLHFELAHLGARRDANLTIDRQATMATLATLEIVKSGVADSTRKDRMVQARYKRKETVGTRQSASPFEEGTDDLRLTGEVKYAINEEKLLR